MKLGILLLVGLLAVNAQAAGDGARSSEDPLESFVGHYMTGQAGEGVFIEHAGSKAFLTLVTYEADGRATWFVMPDARWQLNASAGRSEFSGEMFRVRRGDESPPALHLTLVGSGTWYPTGPDTIRFTATFGNPTRTLRRFRL